MSRDPHYLRVARALALITGLAGVATGCGGDDSSPGTDSGMVADGSMRIDGSGGNDSGGGTDAGGGMDGGGGTDGGGGVDGTVGQDSGGTDGGTAIADAGPCPCDCWEMDGSSRPVCPSGDIDLLIRCGCVAIGPLAPPDLPV